MGEGWKNEESPQNVKYSINRTDFSIVDVKKEEKYKRTESLFKELMIKMFPNLRKDIHIHGQKFKFFKNFNSTQRRNTQRSIK
jgi:hypothetical protein